MQSAIKLQFPSLAVGRFDPESIMSRHVASLADSKPRFSSSNGSIHKITADEISTLKNLSIQRLELGPSAIREPHCKSFVHGIMAKTLLTFVGHINANEMLYVLSGKVFFNILDSGSEFAGFTVEAGQMIYVESGSLHYVENLSDSEPAVLILCLRHERPEEFSLYASFGAMSNAVLGNTYDMASAQLANLKRDTNAKWIVKRKGPAHIPDTAAFGDAHKFDVEKMSAPVSADIGSARTAKSQFWPILKDMAMYSLRVEEEGMREPHWHPKTGELGYVHQGRARMSIMDPDGRVDTYTLQPGDVYFVPAAYPHQIEVLGEEKIHFLIFFDQPMPYDVGYRASATAISKPVMAATFGLDEAALPTFPQTVKDPLIVKRFNPVDPVIDAKL